MSLHGLCVPQGPALLIYVLAVGVMGKASLSLILILNCWGKGWRPWDRTYIGLWATELVGEG